MYVCMYASTNIEEKSEDPITSYAPTSADLIAFCKAFFLGMNVELLPVIPLVSKTVHSRMHQGHKQVLITTFVVYVCMYVCMFICMCV